VSKNYILFHDSGDGITVIYIVEQHSKVMGINEKTSMDTRRGQSAYRLLYALRNTYIHRMYLNTFLYLKLMKIRNELFEIYLLKI